MASFENFFASTYSLELRFSYYSLTQVVHTLIGITKELTSIINKLCTPNECDKAKKF